MDEEKYCRVHIDAIRRVDSVLKGPVRSLIQLACDSANQGDDDHPGCDAKNLYFPPWVADRFFPGPGKKEDTTNTTNAVCCATLQRISRQERRFGWLSKEDLRQLKCIKECLAEVFVPPPDKRNLQDYISHLKSNTFGDLNPFTASQVFRVLSQEGEELAHSGIGLFCFFAMVWSLLRKHPEGRIRGARLDPWGPTAHVTAKCMFPIGKLWRVCHQRARLFEKIGETIKEIEAKKEGINNMKDGNTAWEQWNFAVQFDLLATELFELDPKAISRGALGETAKKIEGYAGSLTPFLCQNEAQKQASDVWDKVRTEIAECVKKIGVQSQSVLDEARPFIGAIKNNIITRLDENSGPVWTKTTYPADSNTDSLPSFATNS